MSKNILMKSSDVTYLYNLITSYHIEVWVDGGWCVDALLNTQLRPHKDLDIAIEYKNTRKLYKILTPLGYKKISEDSKYNFVLQNDNGKQIDVHTFVFNENKTDIVDGVKYPINSLSGVGTIDNLCINCISAKYMIQFLAPWISKWPEKYLVSIQELCKKFKLSLPKEYNDYTKEHKIL